MVIDTLQLDINIFGDEMSYYAVIYQNECKITGPHFNWKLACMSEFSCISSSMRVKYLTENYDWIKKGDWLERILNDESGWFVPMILGTTLERTLDVSKALGPDEIGSRLSSIGLSVQGCEDVVILASLREEAVVYLRHMPMCVCESFNRLCDLRAKYLELRNAEF